VGKASQNRNNRLKKISWILAALVAGFINAFLTAGVHSLFFMMLPLLAFTFGYFSTWRRGLLYGFLLFVGYTFAMSMIWWGIDSPNLLYPLPYITAFIAGGFGILVIGTLAPMVKNRMRSFGSLLAFIALVMMTSWCGYSAMPHYSYYYQVAIQSSEDLKNVELYLPLGTVSGEPYEELYNQVYKVPGHLTENFTQELVDTEYGKMLKLTIPNLKKDDVPDPRYTANIIWKTSAPLEILQLMPKSDVEPVNSVTWEQHVGPVKAHESLIVERFNVPLKITSEIPGSVKLTLWNRTDRGEAVNFTFSKSYPYTERIDYGDVERDRYNLTTSDEWVMVPVEATIVANIRGISD
jgi:hypothetical protein